MKRKILFGLSPWFAGILAIWLIFTSMHSQAMAAPAAQYTPLPTPTPGSDGRIVYIAQEKDSAWRIAAIFGIDLATLRALNKWAENPIIKPGDEIILGFAGPEEITPTLGPSPTPQPLLPTETSQPGLGNLCILLYNDLNGDSIRQEEEPSIPGGAISISSRSGTVSKTEDTQDGLDHQCFEDLPEGVYNISLGVPDGYNPTTVMNLSVTLKAGDINYLDFGAQANTQTILEQPAPQGSGKSPVLGVIGGLILALGVGLGLFAGRLLGTGAPKKNKLFDKQ
jgi:hypothetical protein